MVSKAAKLLNQLLSMGIQKDTLVIEAQKNYLFNLFLLVASPFALLSLVINLQSGNYFPALMNFFQLSIFFLGFYIAYSSKNLQLRPFLLMTLVVIAIFSAFFFKNGSEYRLLIMLIAAVVLFEKRWQYLSFAFFTAFAFVFIRAEDMRSNGMGDRELFENILKIGIPLLLFVFSLFYFKHIYFTNLQQLENTNFELEFARQQKEKILQTVAHDLRSPINNISGMSKLMLSDNQTSQEHRELLQMIDHSADTSISLINNLLHFSNEYNQKTIYRESNLSILLKQWLPTFSYMAREKNITINFSGENASKVMLDAEKLERVFTNLISNAVKFSPDGSEISINLMQSAEKILVRVADQGIGIPPALQTRVFDVYTSAKRNGTAGEKSFGLGLSICKQIVEDHKGTIEVESELGKGTAFIVSLPYSN